jgi:uncharacterized protein (TIGR00297 family)
MPTEFYVLLAPVLAVTALSYLLRRLTQHDVWTRWLGPAWGRRFYNLTGEHKSWSGSLVFAAAAAGVLAWHFSTAPALPYPAVEIAAWSVLLAIVLAALEALGSWGWPYVLVPLGAAALLADPAGMLTRDGLWFLAATLAAAVPFATYTVRKGALTADGAVLAALIGVWVVYFAGLIWLLPLFVFFGSSTALGRLLRRRAPADVAAAKHGRPRDYRQVLCNGGVYAALATGAALHPVVPTAMLVSLAVSTSDTWSSEIGIAWRGATYDIVRWRRQPVGLSGGVSLVGTLAGLAGALVLAWIGHLLLDRVTNPGLVARVTAAGFTGMLVDSVLGALVQARYRAGERLVDEPDGEARLVAGWRWLDNDRVNLVSNVLVTGAWILIAEWGLRIAE